MKICSTCKVGKSFSEFYKNRSMSDGHQPRCKACQKRFDKEIGADGLSNRQRKNAKIGADGLTSRQRSNKKIGEDGLTNPQRWQAKNPDKVRAAIRKSRYGILPYEFDALLSKQGGTCAICGGIPKRACVDHDHASGKVRAILCHCCNTGIGMFNDSAKIATAAAAYLTKHGNP